MDPRRLGRDKRDPPVPGAQWTRASSVATSATLPCAVSAGLPCGAVVGADVLGGPRVRWRFRVRAAPPRSRQARPSRARHAMDPCRLGRDKRDPPVPGAQWTRAALGRDKRGPPVRRIRRVTMWCRGRGRRPRRPARPMAFPCTCRAASVATSATLPCPARNGPVPPRSRQARPSRARRAMDPRRPRSRQARPSRAPYPPGYHVVPW